MRRPALRSPTKTRDRSRSPLKRVSQVRDTAGEGDSCRAWGHKARYDEDGRCETGSSKEGERDKGTVEEQDFQLQEERRGEAWSWRKRRSERKEELRTPVKAGGSEAGTEPGQALVLASDELIPGRDVPVKAGKSSCVAGAEEPSILHGEFFSGIVCKARRSCFGRATAQFLFQ